MIDTARIDYSELDRPDVLSFLFYPRPESGRGPVSESIADLLIPVEDNHHVGARLHVAGCRHSATDDCAAHCIPCL